MLKLSIFNADQQLLACAQGEEAVLVYEPEYAEGDHITVTCDQENSFLVIRLDDAMAESFVFLNGNTCRFDIPFGEAANV